MNQLWLKSKRKNTVSGPLAVKEIRDLVAQGLILPSDEVSLDKEVWRRLSDIRGIKWPVQSDIAEIGAVEDIDSMFPDVSADSSVREAVTRVPVLPKRLREKVSRHNRSLNRVSCEECGYVGPMGVLKESVPWFFSWWIIIALILTGIGTIPAFILGFARGMAKSYIVECPDCESELNASQGKWGEDLSARKFT